MPFTFLRHIRRSASQMAYGSAFYDWSLRGDVPDRLIVRPVDPWPGEEMTSPDEDDAFGVLADRVDARRETFDDAEDVSLRDDRNPVAEPRPDRIRVLVIPDAVAGDES